jgi:2-methylcitrate dehydratase PrpD
MTSMHSAEEPIAPRLAAFTTGLRYEDLPAEIIAAAKALVLDQLGCELIGSTMPWVDPALKLVQLTQGARPEGTIVNHGSRFLAADAAFVNATFGQACELDDVAYGSSGHMGAATIPVALAMGERERIDGREFIVSIVAGFEVLYRMMAAVRPYLNRRGFHSQSVGGPFAGATVAGKILGLSHDQMVHALAIAGSHASGSTEYDHSGGEVKRLHAGLGARGGVHAALLAKFGLTGPPTIIEGKRGFCNIFAEQSDPSRITEGLGTKLHTDRVFFKIYPAASAVQTAISACARLVDEHNISPAQVARIQVGVEKHVAAHNTAVHHPTDAVSAQSSLAFSLALVVCKRSSELAHYMDPALWNAPQMVDLMARVEAHAEPAAVGEKDHMATVSIELNDGRKLEATEEFRKGSPRNPATKEELASKARSLAGAVLKPKRIDQLVQLVEHLEEVDEIGTLARLLVRKA